MYNFSKIEKINRPELKGFRGAFSVLSQQMLLTHYKDAYYTAKKGAFNNNFSNNDSASLGLMTARTLVEELVGKQSIDVIQENLVKRDKIVFVPIHGLTVDSKDIANPKDNSNSHNFLSYSLALHLSEEMGQEFYPWVEPTNTIKRSGLHGAEIFAFQSTFRAGEDQKDALKGRRIILVDNNVNGGASAYSTASVVMNELGAKSIAGFVSLSQQATRQTECDQMWDFLPNSTSRAHFEAKMNFVKDTGKFEETMGYGIDRLTQKEMHVLGTLLKQESERKNSRYVSLDKITEDIISLRKQWADTYYSTPTQSVQTDNRNSLIYA